MEILERDANIDNLVLLVNPRFGTGAMLENHINTAIELRQRTSKPVMAILSCFFAPAEVQQAGDIIQKLQAGDVPTFITLERGAHALRNVLDYYSFKNNAAAR